MAFYFYWLEHTDFSTWLRESPSLLVFPTILILHTIGMAFLAGDGITAGDNGVRSSFDVVPTIFELLGEPFPARLSGRSLLASAQ